MNALPIIKLYAHFKAKSRFQYECETYSDEALFFLRSGKFEFLNRDDEWTTVTAGDAVFCPKGFTFHRNVIEMVTLDMIKFTTHADTPAKTTVFRINDRISEALDRTVSRFCTEADIDTITRHYCTDICLEVEKILLSAEKDGITLPCEIENMFNSRYTESITNDMLCELLHCSEATMIALIKRAKNKTPQQLLTEKRLKLARRLLVETNDNVYSIAEKCGYSDPLYFSRLFKNQTGLTATEFRKKYRI